MKEVRTSAPGKLMLAGEYSVLQVGNPCLVAAINVKVRSHLIPLDAGLVFTIDDFGIKDKVARFEGGTLVFDYDSDDEREKLVFLEHAVNNTLNYLSVGSPAFHLRVWGELSRVKLEDGSSKKVGFGSSAAATVAIVSSLLAGCGVDVSTSEAKKTIFKLSAFSHYEAQGKIGSCFDIAASTFGGLLKYSRFDPDWLVEAAKSKSLKELIDSKWKGLSFEEIPLTSTDSLAVCWTKSSASTVNLVKQVYKFKDANPTEYASLMNKIVTANARVFNAWINERSDLLEAMKENESALKALGENAGVEIETDNLKRLCEIAEAAGCPAKLSGAGGGDCGFAVVTDPRSKKALADAWADAGLFPLDVEVSEDGVRID